MRTQLIKRQIELLKKLVELLKVKLSKQKKYYCLHHSATPRDTTRTETIIKNIRKRYNGKCFYDIIIDKTGLVTRPENVVVKSRGTTDICVIGNFTTEKPSKGQIEAVKSIIKGSRWTTHKELAEKGLATKSLCPGNLKDYINL